MDLTVLQVSHGPEFSKHTPDTTVTAGGGINKNSVSGSITRQQFRQHPSRLCAITPNMRGQTHAGFFSHVHSFTLTVSTAARAADGKTREVRRWGKHRRREEMLLDLAR